MAPRLNKITAPTSNEVVLRQRLFTQLDQARQRPVTWIHAPGGSGKSTLAASYLEQRDLTRFWYQVDPADCDPANFFYYLGELVGRSGKTPGLPLLTPEYRQGIDSFTRRYFESFFQHVAIPSVLVLDDLHEADDEQFHGLIKIALQEVPEGVSVFILSRNPPPAPLTRLRASRKLTLLGWEDLRLDRDETRRIIDLYHPSAAVAELADIFHERIHGWVAGLILLLEQRTPAAQLHENVAQAQVEDIFNYFAGELFDKAPEDLRDFLLQTSQLPDVTPAMAASLTDRGDAEDLLDDLHQRHLFTEKRMLPEPVYRYHPLFQEFLRHRVETVLDPAELAALRRESGELLEVAGRLSEAAELYRAGQHWDELTRLILAQAESLLSQGRSDTLGRWLKTLPEERLRSDSWLCYWHGCSLMSSSFVDARSAFVQSLERFRGNGDAAGAYLAWASIVDTYPFELDHLSPLDDWLAVFEELRDAFPVYPSDEIEMRVTASMFVTLVLRPLRIAQIAEWEQRVVQLLLAGGNLPVHIQTGFYRSVYAIWRGDFRKNAEIVRELGQLDEEHTLPPLLRLTVRMLEAMHAWLTGQHQACMQAVDAGLELSEKNGVRAWDLLLYSCGAEGSLVVGDLETARQMHRKLEAGLGQAGSLMINYFHFIAAWLALHEDDIDTALFHLRETADRVEHLGSPYHKSVWHVGYALARIHAEKLEGASADLANARSYGEKMQSRMILFLADLVTAELAFAHQNKAEGLKALAEALAVAREEDYRFWVWFLPQSVAELCAQALEAGIEIEYVRMLIRERQLRPGPGAEGCVDWPWPLQVLTLGEFTLLRDGKPLQYSGKVPKKPLELLKALVARGGRDVSDVELYDDLWPGGDPLTACKSLKTTLHRLRKLLGDDQAVIFHEGRLSLNRERVWVDAWAFEALLSHARQSWQSGHPKQAMPHTERALKLYRGHFLPTDRDKPWAHSRRERLRERFLTNVDRIGQELSEQGATDQAIECYRRSLEIDDRTEALYRQLMSCYQQAGLIDEAVAVYQRCRKILAAVGSEPSAQTRALYQSLD